MRNMSKNKIHPTAIIGEDVIMGENNEIGPYTIIKGPIEIGNNNIIGSHTVLGCDPTDTEIVN